MSEFKEYIAYNLLVYLTYTAHTNFILWSATKMCWLFFRS